MTDPIEQSVLARIRRAVEMTAWCHEVDYDWQTPEGTRWHATLWCNQIGEHVVGYGPDPWTAVQAAHAIKAMADNRGDYP